MPHSQTRTLRLAEKIVAMSPQELITFLSKSIKHHVAG